MRRIDTPIDDSDPVTPMHGPIDRLRIVRISAAAMACMLGMVLGIACGCAIAAAPAAPIRDQAAHDQAARDQAARQASDLPTQDRRHPLEILALSEPSEALKKIAAARLIVRKDDYAEIARLGLAEANACRVIANWRCQRRAGDIAAAAADRSGDVYLQVRARIALGRALSRLGDYNNAARVLAEAQRRLGDKDESALRADILLAYSSISERLGKLEEAYRYAKEGLAYAPAATQADMRLRLLRNMASIATARGKPQEARELLDEAGALLANIKDPKLEAEIWLEASRSARALGDADTVEEMSSRIGAIGARLENTQLRGLSYETAAYAEQMHGHGGEAYALLRRAADAFAQLKLQHDELRVVRAMVDLQIAGTQPQRMSESIARLIRLNDQTIRADREAAAADFEERLRYAQSDAMLATANARAETQRLRAQTNEDKFFYTLAAGVLALCMLAVSMALYVQQRKYAALMRERGQQMEAAIATDFLTGVHSRRHLTGVGHAAVMQARERGTGLAVAIVDIDHFKRINDRYGHAVGDEVLKVAAQAMRAACRDTDTLGRIGGEEFAVVLRGIGPEHARTAAERLRRAVAEVRVRARIGEAEGGNEDIITLTASVGVSCLTASDHAFDHLLIRADRALYRAKESGRDRVEIAETESTGISSAVISETRHSPSTI